VGVQGIISFNDHSRGKKSLQNPQTVGLQIHKCKERKKNTGNKKKKKEENHREK
jgi:hypothetical protein